MKYRYDYFLTAVSQPQPAATSIAEAPKEPTSKSIAGNKAANTPSTKSPTPAQIQGIIYNFSFSLTI